MPFKKERYPHNWKSLSLFIRERDHWCCVFCGAVNKEPHPITGSKVVLTVAHLNQNESNNDPANLASLCQRCHFTHDREDNQQRRVQNMRDKKLTNGQLTFE